MLGLASCAQVGGETVDVLHMLFMLFFVAFFTVQRVSAGAWGVVVAYSALVLLFQYCWLVYYTEIAGGGRSAAVRARAPAKGVMRVAAEASVPPGMQQLSIEGLSHAWRDLLPFYAILICSAFQYSVARRVERDPLGVYTMVRGALMMLAPSAEPARPPAAQGGPFLQESAAKPCAALLFQSRSGGRAARLLRGHVCSGMICARPRGAWPPVVLLGHFNPAGGRHSSTACPCSALATSGSWCYAFWCIPSAPRARPSDICGTRPRASLCSPCD
jgi:hypothetical protein